MAQFSSLAKTVEDCAAGFILSHHEMQVILQIAKLWEAEHLGNHEHNLSGFYFSCAVLE